LDDLSVYYARKYNQGHALGKSSIYEYCNECIRGSREELGDDQWQQIKSGKHAGCVRKLFVVVNFLRI
ncbi:MAG: hypothetical protein RBT15_09290, partial [Gudongella sp.]|nr:hypothetical protein [Gudongella sp.]